MYKFLALFALLFGMKLGMTQQPLTLIKDINTKNDPQTSSDPSLSQDGMGWSCAIFRNEIFFSADDSVHGREIWKTDGTAQGTKMLKDINPGKAPCTDGYNNMQMVEFNGALYFTVDDGEHGIEVWKTDGTTEGTHMLKELQVRPSDMPQLLAAGDKLFINVADNIEYEKTYLYVSDGTAEGTELVQTLQGAWNITAWNDVIFITFRDLANSTASLWRSDGTEEGTYPIMENVPQHTEPGALFYFGLMVPYNGWMYFTTVSTGELFKTDGTVEGTSRVYTFPDGKSRGYGFQGVMDGLLYMSFLKDGAVTLWATDGSEEGTRAVHSFPGALVSGVVETEDVNYLFVIHGNIIPPYDVKELWRTDGTPEGTYMIKDLGYYGYPNGGLFEYNHAIRNGKLIFEAIDDDHGEELWITDGTEAGTHLYLDQTEGPASTKRHYFYRTPEGDYFEALDENGHYQLYKLMDDCPIVQVAETTDTEVYGYLLLDERICFSARLAGHGRELLYYDVTNDPNCLATPVEESVTKSISIYPNPAEGKMLYLHTDTPVSWTLLDSYGRTAMRGQKNAASDEMLDARQLNSGCYVLKAMSAEGTVVQKVIIK